MASENRHNGGGTGPFNFTFPSIQQSDIKVSVNNNDLTSGFTINNYNSVSGGNVTFSSNTASGTKNVRIYRETDPETLAATFVSGSSIRAIDLNTCNKQSLFVADENTTKLNALALGDSGSAIVISGSNIAGNSITTDKILDLEVKSNDISSSSSNDSLRAITTDHIRDDAITADKLANSINTTIAGKANTGANLSTFTNDSGFITSAQVPASFVTGMIMMWSGTIATIPSGWVLCNGSNSTPDLRDKFVVGARQDDSSQAKTNIEGSLKATGGDTTATDTVTISDSDTVSISISGTTNSASYQGGGQGFQGGGNPHAHAFSGSGSDTVNISGTDTVNVDIVPSYYALAFIMKT